MTSARIFSLVLIVGLLVTVPVLAEDSTTKPQSTDALRSALKVKRDATTTALRDYQAARETEKLTKLISFGDKSTDERVGAITEQQKQLKIKGCSAVTLSAITAAFGTVSTSLASQKAAIDVAKTTDELKPLVKNVFQVNRVYMFLIPASRGACLSQKLLDLINGKLADAVVKLKAAGIDTTSIETKLVTAKTNVQNADNIYLQVIKAPGGDDAGNQLKMANAKTSLQAARQTLGDVKSDIGNLIGNYMQKIHPDAPPTTQ